MRVASSSDGGALAAVGAVDRIGLALRVRRRRSGAGSAAASPAMLRRCTAGATRAQRVWEHGAGLREDTARSEAAAASAMASG